MAIQKGKKNGKEISASKKDQEITNIETGQDLEEDLTAFFESKGKTVLKKGTKRIVVDGKVSDPETDRNSVEKYDTLSSKQAAKDQERAEREKRKQDATRAFVFETVEDYALTAKKMERFKDIPLDRVRYAIFLVIPEAQELTKGDFAEYYKISRQTLSEWRLRDDVVSVRDYFVKAYLKSKTPKVLANLLKAASEVGAFGGANTAAIKLFLQYAEDFTEKNQTDLNVAGGLTVQFANVGASPFIQPEDSQPAKKPAEKAVNTKPKTKKKTTAKKKTTKSAS